MRHLRLVALGLLLATSAVPALAAEAAFPGGSRIALAPQGSLVPSRAFAGYEDADNKVAVLLAELPAQAYPETLKSMLDTGTTTPGVTNVKREVLLTRSGAAHVIAGDQRINNTPVRKWILITWNSNYDFAAMITMIVPTAAKDEYPEGRVRDILSTLALRKEVPRSEILGLLPFRVTELAKFKHVHSVAAGRAIMLTDADKPSADQNDQPQMIVSIGPGSPLEASERARFSQQLLVNASGLKDLRTTFSEPLRIGGLPGHEMRLQGKDAKTGNEVTIVQWVRFGPNSFLRIVGISPNAEWQKSFARFRSVRDGIEYR